MLKKFKAIAIVLLATAGIGQAVAGCATHQVGVAPTVRGKYYQAKLEYGNLLVIANEYKMSPTADPVVVAKMQETDLKVQDVEKEIDRLLAEGNINEASNKVDLLVFFVSELRNQLISRGLIKLEGR